MKRIVLIWLYFFAGEILLNSFFSLNVSLETHAILKVIFIAAILTVGISFFVKKVVKKSIVFYAWMVLVFLLLLEVNFYILTPFSFSELVSNLEQNITNSLIMPFVYMVIVEFINRLALKGAARDVSV